MPHEPTAIAIARRPLRRPPTAAAPGLPPCRPPAGISASATCSSGRRAESALPRRRWPAAGERPPAPPIRRRASCTGLAARRCLRASWMARGVSFKPTTSRINTLTLRSVPPPLHAGSPSTRRGGARRMRPRICEEGRFVAPIRLPGGAPWACASPTSRAPAVLRGEFALRPPARARPRPDPSRAATPRPSPRDTWGRAPTALETSQCASPKPRPLLRRPSDWSCASLFRGGG